MDIRQYIALLRRRWLVIVAGAVVGVAALGAVAWSQSPAYTATSKLFVATSGNLIDNVQANQGAQFGEQRVKSYADIVSSPPVVAAVKQQLQLPDSVSDLADEISASAPADTVLINVTVKDGDPARARDIANAVSQQFVKLVGALEKPKGAKVSPVNVSVVQQAQLPSSPSSPHKGLLLSVGLLVGLAAGIAGALLREALDRSVRTRDAAQKAAGAPVIGAITEDDKSRKWPLIVHDDQFSPRAEAFRQLRSNVQFNSITAAVRSLVVTGSVAAEGKTTTASNLAVALAQAGERVILVDADLRSPMLADLLGLDPAVGLTSVLSANASLDDALQLWRESLPLRILTSGPIPPNPSELLAGARMAELIEKLKAAADIVIFDSPPLLPVTDAAALARRTDGALVVCRFGHTQADQLMHAAGSLRAVGATVLGVVLNRVSRRRSDWYGRPDDAYYVQRSNQSPRWNGQQEVDLIAAEEKQTLAGQQ